MATGTGRSETARLLAELCLPAGALRDQHETVQRQFAEALDPWITLLYRADSQGHGEVDFVIRHLLSRAINDVLVAMHLCTHGYFNQALANCRSAHETFDLLRLVEKDEAEARLWVTTTEPWKHFMPRQVRERLGETRLDEMHSFFSEHAHPRFAGAKFSAYGVVDDERPDQVSIRVSVGPFVLDEHPAFWHTVGFLLPLVATVGTRSSALAIRGAVTEAQWDGAFEESCNALESLSETIAMGLEPFCQGDQARAVAQVWKDRPRLRADGSEPDGPDPSRRAES